MSNYPPPPPGNYPPQQPAGYPQPGYAQGGYGPGIPGPRPGNGSAVGSLVCGLLGCIPWITGLLAIILGIMGIKRANQIGGAGKGMAIAGLLLGLLSVILWTLFSGGLWALIAGTAQQRDFAKGFINDLKANNLEVALTKVDSALVPRATVEEIQKRVASVGEIRDLTSIGINASAGTGTDTKWEVITVVTGSTGQTNVVTTLVRSGESFKIVGLRTEN